MVLEEQPHKVCEAMRLFLQGLGYGKSSKKWILNLPEYYLCNLGAARQISSFQSLGNVTEDEVLHCDWIAMVLVFVVICT